MAEKPSLAVQAAKASWLAPLIAIGLSVFTNMSLSGNPPTTDVETARTIRVIVGAIGILIVVAGLAFGVLALFGIRKHGWRGILIPAIVGIVLSSGYLYLVVNTILVVRRLVQEGALAH